MHPNTDSIPRIAALLLLACLPAVAQTPVGVVPDAAARTFCNPLNLDYRFQNNGEVRESADPAMIYFQGDYYLFASKLGGYYWSPDMREWTFVDPSGLGMTEEAIEEYAPAIMEYGGKLYYMVSRNNGELYESTNPKSGQWTLVTQLSTGVDPALLADDDGRVYLYWGVFSIAGWELDPANNFAKIGGFTGGLVTHDTANRGWEGWGDDNNEDPDMDPSLEGAWMTKHNGKYYLEYAAPGTAFVSYADGVAVGDNPLGPFTYQPYSPHSLNSTGYSAGAGHSCTFPDKDGQYWHATTGVLVAGSRIFERRINLFPLGFMDDGQMVANTYLGGLPQYFPGANPGDPVRNNSPGWVILSYNKSATASSTKDGFPVANAFDENIKTSWVAGEGGTKLPGGWSASYYNNQTLSGSPALVRTDASIGFDWGQGSPDPAISVNNFSVRWTGSLTPGVGGDYEFSFRSDDGCRLFLDGVEIITDWTNHGPTTFTNTVTLNAGQTYVLVAEYYEAGGGAVAELRWQNTTGMSNGAGEWVAVDLGEEMTAHAIQVNLDDTGPGDPAVRDDPFRYLIEHSSDGTTWLPTVDKSAETRDRSHDYMELASPVTARHFRITSVYIPHAGVFALRDFRIFGKGHGPLPHFVGGLDVQRNAGDPRNVDLTWNAASGAESHIVRYGIAPDRLFQNHIVRGGGTSLTLYNLNVGVPYYFAVDSMNPCGITRANEIVSDAHALIVEPFTTWIRGFTSSADPALSGMHGDLDGDGARNLLEYGFVLDPSSASSRTAIMLESPAASDFRVRATMRHDDDSLRFSVALSDDLQGWTNSTLSYGGGSWASSDPDEISVLSHVDAGDGTGELVLRLGSNYAAATAAFLRMGISAED